MKGLIIKDIRLVFGRSQTLLLYLGIVVFMSFSMDASFLLAYVCMLFGIIGVSTISYDEFDNGFPFLMSLPVNAENYVRSKYIFCLAMEFLGSLFGLVILTVVSLLRGVPTDVVENLKYVVGYIPMMLLFISIMIFIQIKFGQEKGRTVLFIIYGVIAALAVMVTNIEALKPVGMKIVQLLSSASAAVVLAIASGLVIGLTLIMYRLSVKAMKMKEY